MKTHTILVSFLLITTFTIAQESKYYLGISYGKSFPLGDFTANDINKSNAGFAESGTKLDVYGGYILSKHITFTFTFRYQNFNTNINALTNGLETNNQGTVFIGNSNSWQIYSLLGGIAYKVSISKKFSLFPRIGFGPMLVSCPQFSIIATNENTYTEINGSSETGIGLGYEFGIGLKRNLGKNFCLMPTFTFSGGFVTISDVDTTVDNAVTTSNYKPKISTFNLGLSLAYKF
ncbi:hypothetical protein H8K90_07890 [Winogradskyella echinorum]|uniref:Outer membrane protein beta-barrel domain-containing protein n=1 Tax=Winogradskyella echinorum TaxID=538189 RepID=A0ABR6Y0N5_9FLAO|nr:hypothetical protein [Winogradskyella echinorum]MBC3846296.1 hypothetical protein [Winogradskyella echinorum]MBC5750644.1 hypothetical protein [Winogradskyella echinorum]